MPLGPPKIDWYSHGDPPSRGPVLKAPLINGLMEGAHQQVVNGVLAGGSHEMSRLLRRQRAMANAVAGAILSVLAA